MLELSRIIGRIGIITGIVIVDLGEVYAVLKYSNREYIRVSKKIVIIGLVLALISIFYLLF